LFKNYVKLTLKCRSSCSDVKENLKLATELKSVSCGDINQSINSCSSQQNSFPNSHYKIYLGENLSVNFFW